VFIFKSFHGELVGNHTTNKNRRIIADAAV
jgi:hypothetical protein